MDSTETLQSLVKTIERMYEHSVMIPDVLKREGYNLACLHIMKCITEHPDYRSQGQREARKELSAPEVES